MITANQILAHLVGDYIFQSDWMAENKTKRHWPALVHALSYMTTFLLLTTDWRALAIIAASHFVIDRWRLAKYVCWAKNLLAPKRYRFKLRECGSTGYYVTRPPWLSTWLFIIADNTMHLICNGLALYYFGGVQ